MTSKNFLALADLLKSEEYQNSVQQAIPGKDCITTAIVLGRVQTALANFCEAQNPEFNRSKWLDYIANNEVRP